MTLSQQGLLPPPNGFTLSMLPCHSTASTLRDGHIPQRDVCMSSVCIYTTLALMMCCAGSEVRLPFLCSHDLRPRLRSASKMCLQS